MVPVLCPLSFEDSDDNVKLGRLSDWRQKDGEAVPVGQKSFLVDGEEISILEVRKIELQTEEASEAAAGDSDGE